MEPVLEPPGAGISFPAQLYLRYYVKPFVASKTPWQVSKRRIDRIHQLIFEEVQGLSELELGQRILVPRLRGLEDSSRYWSILMTMEHVMIVGRKIYMTVPMLMRSHRPEEKADTAKVKPAGNDEKEILFQDFQRFMSKEFHDLNQQIPQEGISDSSLKYEHPWFGLMTARQWYWLLHVHANIHLQQIREIKKRLKIHSGAEQMNNGAVFKKKP